VGARIYLDHHAASPLGGAAREAMLRALGEIDGNPASVHASGRRARAVVERAREQVAAAVGASPSEVVLTSGGTEACNLGVLGLAPAGGAVLTTALEHPAVSASVASLARAGAPVCEVPVVEGVAGPLVLEGVSLLATQWINHEVGTVLPIEGWCAEAAARGVRVFVDATQALGKVPVAWSSLGAEAMALASHKIGGPAGVGALIVRRGVELEPRMLGGAQERGRRAGTPDVIAIAGFGAACAAIGERLASQSAMAARRDRLEAFLVSRGARVNGARGPRAASACNVSLSGWRGSTLVAALDVEGLEVSAGAACSSGLDRPSPIVRAMAEADADARAASAVRFSLGPETTDRDIDGAIAVLVRVLSRRPS
jgi:cysteine desulfurase